MLTKIIELDSIFPPTEEPRIMTLEKRASYDKTVEEIFQVKNPDPRYMYLHIIAMGAGEYYGPNSRADYFPEKELIGGCTTFNNKKRCYGFHTFETHAKVYREHVLPPKGKDYGDVLKAHYNQKMHRVELLVAIDKEKAPWAVQKVESGQPLKFSMGANVAYDECSICGNRAYKSTAEYCKHGKYELNKIYPDGRKVYRINYMPIFNDISIVRKPADSIAYMLRKVASADEQRAPWQVVIEAVYKEGYPQAAKLLEVGAEMLDFKKVASDVSNHLLRLGLDLRTIAKSLLIAYFVYHALKYLTGHFQAGTIGVDSSLPEPTVILPGMPYRVRRDGTLEPIT